MIAVDGYKAFRGTMRITPKNQDFESFELTCDWLYKPAKSNSIGNFPTHGYWYGKGRSFREYICEVVEDLT